MADAAGKRGVRASERAGGCAFGLALPGVTNKLALLTPSAAIVSLISVISYHLATVNSHLKLNLIC